MIRLELDGVRNVVHGVIDFHDLESGGSIMGLYGPNGSGKTCVIEAMDILRRLMRGERLPEGSAEVVNNDTRSATLTATYRVEGVGKTSCVEYSVILVAGGDGRAHVVGETLRMGRTIIGRTVGSDGVSLQPAYVWRSLLSLDGVRGDMNLFERAERFEGASFLFAPYAAISRNKADGTTMLGHLVEVGLHADGLSARSREYIRTKFAPVSEAVRILADHAHNDIHVCLAWRGDATEIPGKGEDDFTSLDLLRTNLLADAPLGQFRETIGTYNMILPTLIPNLRLSLRESPASSDDAGNRRTRVEVMASRGGASFPLRLESEGVIRIIRMLSYCIRAYNDPDALVAIDGIDEGIHEVLFGELIRQMASGIRGQLVFAAHNLRALEVLPRPANTITLATGDPSDGFEPFRHAGSGNARNRYLTTLDRKNRMVGESSDERIGAALRVASNPAMLGHIRDLERMSEPPDDDRMAALRQALL
ncbi:ATP-binding protein [Bifidobacterium callitrichidarum]|nr:ATP-binding protein [Bifidobacterium callitrichidarum]